MFWLPGGGGALLAGGVFMKMRLSEAIRHSIHAMLALAALTALESSCQQCIASHSTVHTSAEPAHAVDHAGVHLPVP